MSRTAYAVNQAEAAFLTSHSLHCMSLPHTKQRHKSSFGIWANSLAELLAAVNKRTTNLIHINSTVALTYADDIEFGAL